MNELKTNFLNARTAFATAKVKFDELLDQLNKGAEVDEAKQEEIENVYVLALIELEEHAIPYLVDAAQKEGKSLTASDIADIFTHKQDQAIDLVMRVKL